MKAPGGNQRRVKDIGWFASFYLLLGVFSVRQNKGILGLLPRNRKPSQQKESGCHAK